MNLLLVGSLVWLPFVDSWLEDARTQIYEGELVAPGALKYVGPDYIHLSMIVTNLVYNKTQNDGNSGKSNMLKNLETFTESLLNSSTGTPLHLIFITDPASKPILQVTLRDILGRLVSSYIISRPSRHTLDKDNWDLPKLKVEYVDFEAFIRNHREQLDGLKEVYCPTEEFKIVKHSVEGPLEFGMQCGEKYRMDLFYLAPLYYKEFPVTLEHLIVLDIDLVFKVDLSELHTQFDLMKDREMIGAGKEFSLVYKTLSVVYRDKNYLGMTGLSQGLNTGVVLFNLKKLREDPETAHHFSAHFSKDMAHKYSFKGVSGDQCMLTLLSWELPHLFYALPCTFNNQVLHDPPPQDPDQGHGEEEEYETFDMFSLIMDGKPPREEFRKCDGKKIMHHNGSNP